MLANTAAANENARLSVLHDHDALNQQFGATFDRFARMASALTQTPAGLVAFVDGDRQVFRGSSGTTLAGTPRDEAFCDLALLGPDVTVVPDVSQDPRFAGHRPDSGVSPVRFFAGAPIITRGDRRAGAVCALDSAPRSLTAAQIGLLRDLAASVATSLELYNVMRDVRELAMTDSLTGIGNRAHFHDALRREATRARRQMAPLSVLYLDCDGFSDINNTLGHAAGDQLLREIGAVMRDHLRGSDTLGRLGGDEFGLILPDTGPAAARGIADRILGTCRRLTERYEHPVSASVGVATFITVPDDLNEIVAVADATMYDAKRQGRDRVSASVVRAGHAPRMLRACQAGGHD